MQPIHPKHGIGTLVTHYGEMNNPINAHVMPIYQTSAFVFPDVATGASVFKGETPGYIYTRLDNPNLEQLAAKIAMLEGLDLLRANPAGRRRKLWRGRCLPRAWRPLRRRSWHASKVGKRSSPRRPFTAPRITSCATWPRSMASRRSGWATFPWRPGKRLSASILKPCWPTPKSPANPTMSMVDLAGVAAIAHRYGAWLAVDNTFATPYCQRPLSLGADVVVHSTTKYLSGHGLVIGGAVVSAHVDYMRTELTRMFKILGGCPAPFDTWLANIGLKTFELRMQRHCENALCIANFLEDHPAVARVYYPGLESYAEYGLACRQMHSFGGMISFELKGGYSAGETMMNRVRVATLVVSLGNVDTLICHPASMTHSNVSPEARAKMGLGDGLVRLSVGIEDCDDLIADLDQAMR